MKDGSNALAPLLEAIREVVFDALAEFLDGKPANDWPPNDWMTRAECARYLKVSTAQVDRLVAKGLPVHRVGESPRFRIDEVRAWVSGPKKADSGERRKASGE